MKVVDAGLGRAVGAALLLALLGCGGGGGSPTSVSPTRTTTLVLPTPAPSPNACVANPCPGPCDFPAKDGTCCGYVVSGSCVAPYVCTNGTPYTPCGSAIPPVAIPSPTPTPTPEATPSPAPTPSASPGPGTGTAFCSSFPCYTPGKDGCNCGDLGAQAQKFHDQCDPQDVNRLDADKDGLACEG